MSDAELACEAARTTQAVGSFIFIIVFTLVYAFFMYQLVIKPCKAYIKGKQETVDQKQYEPIWHVNPEGTPIGAWPTVPAPGQ